MKQGATPHTPPASPQKTFKLQDHFSSPNKTIFRVVTSLPKEEKVNALWEINPNLSQEITDCLKLLYSHVTERGGHSQGKPYFFHHVASTSLYESMESVLIGNKDHGKKAATIFNKVVNTLDKIDRALSSRENSEIEQTLQEFQALLKVHHNALLTALKELPEQTQLHLLQHQSLDIEKIQLIPLSPSKKIMVQRMHPEAKPSTPKRLSIADIKSRDALLATAPPAQPKDEQAKAAPLPVSSSVLMRPRSLQMKKLEQLKSQVNSIRSAIGDMGSTSQPIPTVTKTEPRSTTEKENFEKIPTTTGKRLTLQFDGIKSKELNPSAIEAFDDVNAALDACDKTHSTTPSSTLRPAGKKLF